jgi:hypothetical protein
MFVLKVYYGSTKFVSYESIKRELKIRPTYDCRCDERLKTKGEDSTRLVYTWVGRVEKIVSLVSGLMVTPEARDTRPGQTWKTPKDLSTHESVEHGSGESVGWYVVCMRE